jgi:hypothetical protein
VIGLRVYPVDKSLSIPGVDSYKVMDIQGYKKCSAIGVTDYTDALDYDYYGNINIYHEGRKPYHGIAINYYKQCYDVFDSSK